MSNRAPEFEKLIGKSDDRATLVTPWTARMLASSAWIQTLLANIRAVHGVTSVALSSDFPMSFSNSGARLLIQMDDWPESHVHVVARRSAEDRRRARRR